MLILIVSKIAPTPSVKTRENKRYLLIAFLFSEVKIRVGVLVVGILAERKSCQTRQQLCSFPTQHDDVEWISMT